MTRLEEWVLEIADKLNTDKSNDWSEELQSLRDQFVTVGPVLECDYCDVCAREDRPLTNFGGDVRCDRHMGGDFSFVLALDKIVRGAW